MNKKDSFLQRAGNFFAGKGFYIVLILCVVVIGASAWAMLSLEGSNVEEDQSEVAEVTDQPALYNGQGDSDVQAAEENVDLPAMAESEGDTKVEAPAVASPVPSPSAGSETEDKTEEDDKTIAESPEPSVSEEKPSNNQETAGISGYVWPVGGDIAVYHTTSELIYDKTMSDWRTHTGLDIAAELGTKVAAISSGTVESIVNDDLYGTTITIDHGNDLKSVYSNLAATPTVSEGQAVAAGDTIGAVGNTAIVESGIVTHLHLAVISSDVAVDPLDYLP